jgi:crotonobetainyl-CoA:carnitine CoA-transferase CaiB-like acyl-CoA transferase
MVALTVYSDAHWRTCCAVVGLDVPRWSRRADGRVAAAARLAGALDAPLKKWSALALVDALQARGVAAAVVTEPGALMIDAQLRERGFVRRVVDERGSCYRTLGLPWRVPGDSRAWRAAPVLGSANGASRGGRS